MFQILLYILTVFLFTLPASAEQLSEVETSSVLNYSEDQVMILCYHSFVGINYPTDFTIGEFSNQIQWMKDKGYHFVSYEDIISNRVKGNTNILITIDDGNISISEAYRKVMRHFDIKPLLFVYPGVIDRQKYALSSRTLRQLQEEGTAVGGHGYYHMHIVDDLYKKDPHSFHKEVFTSKKELEEDILQKVDTFAYPYGTNDQFSKGKINEAGYTYAFSLIKNFTYLPLEKNPDLYDLPRWMVTKNSWPVLQKLLSVNIKSGPWIFWEFQKNQNKYLRKGYEEI